MMVSDDGTGFAEKDLQNAMKPFLQKVSETDNEHFNMGVWLLWHLGSDLQASLRRAREFASDRY